MHDLFFVLLIPLTNDIEELKLVNPSRGRDYSEPITEVVLLQELLSPIVNQLVLSYNLSFLGLS